MTQQCVFLSSPSGNSDALKSLRTTVIRKWYFYPLLFFLSLAWRECLISVLDGEIIDHSLKPSWKLTFKQTSPCTQVPSIALLIDGYPSLARCPPGLESHQPFKNALGGLPWWSSGLHVQGTRSHMPQLKIRPAETKTQHSQINILNFKKKING